MCFSLSSAPGAADARGGAGAVYVRFCGWLPGPERAWLAGLFVLHLALGSALGLSVDEAHYALYALHPALSYFDHPPLVGWVQWPLVVLGASVPWLRVLPGLLWVGSVALAYRLTLRLHAGAPTQAAQAARWAVLALALSPLLHVLGLGLLPDTLLMFWSAALLDQTLRLRDAASLHRPWPWLALGALLGLAGLSKYTAIFSALACALVLLHAHGPRLLRTPWPWVACGLALLLVSPVLLWNAQHDWISLRYQLHHGGGGAWQPAGVLRFLVLQCLAFGPLMLWGLGAARSAAHAARPAFWFFAVPFAVLAVLAGGGTSLPHWTAPAWVVLAPWAGMGLAQARAHGGWRARLPWACAWLQALACVALAAALLSGGMPFMAGRVASAQSSDPPNPLADLHGWDLAGARARELARAQALPALALQNWTLASRFAWYAQPLPVHVLEDRYDQFDLWFGKLPVGADALLVEWSGLPYLLPVGGQGFAACRLLERLPVMRMGQELEHFDFYACRAWGGQSPPQLAPAVEAAPRARAANSRQLAALQDAS